MERKRITISIKKDLLKSIDKIVDGTSVRNRSHAIETLAKKALGNKDINNAVILLGGQNAMEYIPAAKEYILKLRNAGFEKVYIAVGYLADKIKDELGNGDEYGLSLKYIEKGEGSGGAVLALKRYFENSFLVINTDTEFNTDLEQMFNFHNKFHSTASIITNDADSMSGIYLFEPKIFQYIPSGFSMLETDIFSKLLLENELVTYIVK